MATKRVKKPEVRYFVYKEFVFDEAGRSDEEIVQQLRHNPELRKKRFSFVSLCVHPGRGTLFAGTTNTGHDLLVELDPKTGAYRSCEYAKVSTEHEVKIHRGLWLDEKEDALYFATSTLSPLAQTHKAAGAPLVRYDIKKDSFDLLARPRQGEYIQATVYDGARKLLYYFGIPTLCFGVYDLKKKKVLHDISVESIPHISALDDDGGCWGTAGQHHVFFRYHPEKDEFEFFDGQCAMPTARQGSNIMYLGAGPVDSMINGGDGFLYVGTALGELYRLNPRTQEVRFLGKPHWENRIQGLTLAPDGLIYGAGGRRETFLFSYDRKTNAFNVLSDLVAPDGKRCTYPHDIVAMNGALYIGETDTPKRSGYIWEVTV
jgi:hypothetical protein